MNRAYLRAASIIVISWSMFSVCIVLRERAVRSLRNESLSQRRGSRRIMQAAARHSCAPRRRVVMIRLNQMLRPRNRMVSISRRTSCARGSKSVSQNFISALAVHANIWPPEAGLYKIRFPVEIFTLLPEYSRRRSFDALALRVCEGIVGYGLTLFEAANWNITK